MLPVDPKQVEYWKRKAQKAGYIVDALIDRLRPIYDDVIYIEEGIILDEKQELIIYMRLCGCSRMEVKGLFCWGDNTFKPYVSRSVNWALKILDPSIKSVTWNNFRDIIERAGYYNKPENEQEKLVDLSNVLAVINRKYQNGEITKEQMIALKESIIKTCE
jgi:hypothetical protein